MLASWRTRLALAALVAVACVEPTGPGEARLGQVRLRAMFAAGETESELRVTVDSVRVRITREGELAPLVDTTTAYDRDGTMGWVLDLVAAEEALPVLVELRGGGALLYRADSAVLAEEGRVGEADVHDVFVSYVGPVRTMAIEVSPAGASLEQIDATAALAAVARDRAGAAIAGAVFGWASSAPEVVTVDAAGVVTAVAEGSAEVSASHDGISTSVTVTVDVADGVATTVHSTIDAAPSSVPADGVTTATITVRLFDGLGAPLTASGGTVTLASDLGVRSALTDNGDGTYTASIRSEVAGTATITGTLDGGAMADIASVEFTPWVVPSVVTTVVVEPAGVTLTALGATQPYAAVAHDQFGAVMDGVAFAWSSSAPAIATIDPSGLATAVEAGTTTITASVGAVSGTATLAVVPIGEPTTDRSTIDASPTSVPADGASTSTITVRLVDGHGTPLSTSGGVITLTTTLGALTAVTDHGDGTYTARLGSATPGVATVAGALNGEALADDATVEFAPFVPPRVLTSIEVSPRTVTLTAIGATQAFTAVARDADGVVMEDVTFAWASSTAEVATIDGVTGVAMAVAAGSTTISAAAGEVSGAATLTVTPAGVPTTDQSTIDAAPANVPADGSTPAAVTVRLVDGNGVPLTASGGTVALVSSLGSLTPVTDNGDGTYTAALTSETPGSAIITGTLDGEPIDDDATVAFTLVVPPVRVLTSIEVSPASATLAAFGATTQLTAVARDQLGAVMTGVDFAWSSVDEAVAVVDAGTGLATAVANGVTTVRATAVGVAGEATLTVAQRAATIELSVPCPPDGYWTDGSTRTSCNALTSLGARLQLTAIVRDANGNLIVAPAIAWSSSEPAALTVDATGLVTAVDNGPSLVTASTDGVQGEIAILVRQVVRRVVVTPATLTLAVGLEHQLVAVAYDANDAPVLDAVIAWSSREPAIVHADANGRVMALGAGQAIVKAMVGSVFGSAIITVP